MLRTGQATVSCALHGKAWIDLEYIKAVTAEVMLMLKHY
jgi:hypothetical protein